MKEEVIVKSFRKRGISNAFDSSEDCVVREESSDKESTENGESDNE